MKRFYQMFVALALVALGATSVSAQERIPFDAEHFTFHNYDGWDGNAVEKGVMAGNFILDQADGCPIGDTSCNAWVDLTNYTKMFVQMEGCDADGNPNGSNPRIFINRLEAEGQFNADRTIAKCLVIPNDGTWAADYYTKDGDILVIDLKKIAKDFGGFVHFHSIKGSAWNTKTIVHSIEVEKPANQQPVGWTSIINNGNFEGDDFSSFVLALQADSNDGDKTYASDDHVTEGVGASESKALVVQSMANAPQTWSTQLFVKLSEPVTEGLRWRFSMDVKADAAAHVTTGSHAAPRAWIAGGIIPEFDVTTDWQTITAEGEITKELADKAFGSIAFDLNNDKVNANTFYFDNIKFDVFKLGTTASFSNDVVLVDFGFDTNLPDLVKASGQKRLMFPTDCASVKVNGNAAEIFSIEGFADGRFYIFLNEGASDGDEVSVSFTNPADEKFRLVYTSGAVNGQEVKNFADVAATLNAEVEDNEGYPYEFVTPVIVKADPENGSFNLPNSIKEFKVAFDKNVEAAALTATLNGDPLTVTPNTGYATEFTLTRSGDADLATGEYTIHVTKIYPESRLSDEVFGDSTYTFNVGKVEVDPNDVEETIMTDDFAASGSSWIVNSGSADGSMQDANAGSGCRLMHNQSGFTKDILYLGQRDTPNGGVALYGTKEDAKLTLAAKNYHLTLKAAKWDGGGAARTLKVQVLPYDAVNFTTGAIIDDTKILVEESKAIEPDFKTTTKSTDFDIVIPVTVAGDYIIRLVPGNAAGSPAGYNDASAIGNVKVQYLPNTAGAEWIRLLDTALEAAKAARDKYAAERYAGDAQTAQSNAITEYEAAKENFTNPSAYQDAAADLTALSETLEKHGALCDEYDTQIKKGIDVIRQVSAEEDNGKPNAKRKFMATELFAELTAVVAKYHGSSEWVDIADHTEEDPENPVAAQWQLNYSYDVLTEDAVLTAAIAELTDIVKTTDVLFTAGESKTGDSGVKVLVERLRRGAETLKSLGVAEDDEYVVAANNALTDDDELATRLMNRITLEVYKAMKDPESTLFEGVTNEVTLETVYPKYDMSVFFKNPNAYALQVSAGFTPENVPGWTTTIGNGGVTTMWVGGTPRNIPGIAEDIAMSCYHAATRYEQTVTNLPFGIYTVVLDAASWADEDVTNAFVFAKTSETPAAEEGVEEDRTKNFAATADVQYYGQYQGHHDQILENIVVADGLLTVGANFPATSQFMFDQIKAVYLTAAANGVNYADLYNEAVTGIDGTEVAPAKVRAIELFDLNGRRVAKAQKGLVIVKKYLSNGTVKAEKVVVK